ncbi:hypothetical protein LMH87_009657 [Akanthomyces muscarius]|uniref:Uncharacterized protein n=2 Tax=Akanthomyces muscarius TaxID=2231603 RepID=A0A9W8QBT1_AKAMU|nr:hypothetical protein LMH87_009657 [Akanthomyces muscarius]KAJ4153155.1 hypothetical protein LMH87_009657 [Akanthomyces muscarius]
MSYSQVPAYVLGTACCGRGLMGALSPRSEYGHVGLRLEGGGGPISTPDGGGGGVASPLMYFKAIREASYGAALIALQYQGHEASLTTLIGILSAVRLADGAVVWWHGGEPLRWRALGHWITGVGFLGWFVWRQGVV